MKSRYQIRFDFQNAISQARKLDDLADRLERTVVRRMDDVASDLHAAWKSDSANRYIQKEQELKGSIKDTVDELRCIADDIRTIARRIYDAEMRALRIAQQRKA